MNILLLIVVKAKQFKHIKKAIEVNLIDVIQSKKSLSSRSMEICVNGVSTHVELNFYTDTFYNKTKL